MEAKLARVESWLKKSGMKVNDAKTCLCLFYNKDTAPIELVLNNCVIKSEKRSMFWEYFLIRNCNGLIR